MKIHVISDVHLEFQKWRKQWDITSIDCDVHVLAGDIGNGFLGLEFALQNFTKPVIYVAGNHEFYCQRPMQDWWRKAREKVADSHVHLLENESVVIDGVRFLGCTLWSDFNLIGDDRQEDVGRIAEKESNDYQQIFLTRRGVLDIDGFTRKRSGDRLTWPKVVELHQKSREFLEDELDRTGDWNQTVVVTHHAPSIHGIEQPPATGFDAACASHLDHLVAKTDLWLHGHTHMVREYLGKRGGRVVQNARGYRDNGEYATGFIWNTVIDVKPRHHELTPKS